MSKVLKVCALAIAAIILALLVYILFLYVPSSKTTIAKEDLAKCSSMMGVTLPDSARPLGLKIETGWMDDNISLKFEIPRRDLKAFISSSPFANVSLREDRRFIHDSNNDWWKPDGPVKFKSGQVSLPSAEFMNILIDLDKEETAIVYLEWIET